MKREQFICDECGAERKEANHWFVVVENRGAAGDEMHPGFELVRWGHADSRFRQLHLCGQKCVHAVIDRFMSIGQLEKKPADGQGR